LYEASRSNQHQHQHQHKCAMSSSGESTPKRNSGGRGQLSNLLDVFPVVLPHALSPEYLLLETITTQPVLELSIYLMIFKSFWRSFEFHMNHHSTAAFQYPVGFGTCHFHLTCHVPFNRPRQRSGTQKRRLLASIAKCNKNIQK